MRIVTVGQLTAYLKELLDTDPIVSDIWVRGEVTSFHRSAAGHCYFSMNSNGAQLSCVLFRGNLPAILAMPEVGDAVIAHGRISIYETQGRYQLYVDNIAPEGTGLLQLQFEEMRQRLQAEGLFAEERKRALPVFPRVIGVVTSEQGAVWHDIQTVVSRRFPLTELVLAPSAVQGADAPGELVAGLRAIQEDGRSEVVIIGRGGGSPEDLAAFNDEDLARAIYACSIPVVSAVGHETDISISDLVADLRAPTPSAAAEQCVPDQDDIRYYIAQCLSQARVWTRQERANACDEVAVRNLRIKHHSPAPRVERARQDLDLRSNQVRDRILRRITDLRHRTERLQDRSHLLNPRDVLQRGYAVVSKDDAQGRRITHAAQLAPGDRIRVTFQDSSVKADVAKETE